MKRALLLALLLLVSSASMAKEAQTTVVLSDPAGPAEPTDASVFDALLAYFGWN